MPVQSRLRYARPDDAEAISEYFFRCWGAAFANLVPEDALDGLEAGYDIDRWHRWLDRDSEQTTVVADLDGQPIGHTTIRADELVHLFIDPDHWGQGLGRTLLAVAERMLAQRGNERIFLHTMVGNEPAISLYTAHGWEMTDDTNEDEINGVTYLEHVLVKDLGSTATASHISANRKHWDDDAPNWLERGRISWAGSPSWGELGVPESQVGALPDLEGRDVVELGCGTGYFSAWCLRAGARWAVGLDNSSAQLRSAKQLQEEFDLPFPLVWADAERVPLIDDSFDVVISEYGAAIWCEPDRWLAEAARLLRPGGDLVFLGSSGLINLCVSDFEDDPTLPALRRPQRGMRRFEWPDTDGVEFHVSHGEMIRLLRQNGFVVQDLIELYAPESGGPDRYSYFDAEWARQWPAEEIWVASAGTGARR